MFPTAQEALGILSASGQETPDVGHILEVDGGGGEGKASLPALSHKVSSTASTLLAVDVTGLGPALPIPGSAGG